MMLRILFAGNQNVFDGMVISALSIVKHTKSTLRIFLLTMDLTDQNPAFLPITEGQRAYVEEICKSVNPESRVFLLDVGEFYRETMPESPNAETGYTPYTFLRLYADRIPEIPDKAIYLDTDTVVCRDLGELFSVELGDAELGCVRDRYGCHFFGINYCNAGVLLLNMKRIRETGLFRKALDACAKRKIFLPDQTALNRYAKKKKILPRRFNEQKCRREDTVIRHFSMTIQWIPFRTQNIKPWQVDRVHTVLKTHGYDEILEDYLNRKPSFPNQAKEKTT